VVLLKVVGWVMWMAGVVKVAEVYLEIRKSLEDQVRVSVCSPLVLICTVIFVPFSKPLKRFGVKTNVCCVMLCNSGLNSQQNVQVLHVEFGWYSALSCCLITFVINQPVSMSDQNPVIRNRNIGVSSKVYTCEPNLFSQIRLLVEDCNFLHPCQEKKIGIS